MELEEYEFDILWDEKKECWVAKLMPGSYLLTVKAKEYMELNQCIEVGSGPREFKLDLIKLNQI